MCNDERAYGLAEQADEHREERARQHDVRVLILALLAKAGRCLTPGEIRSRLPGPRRPQATVDYHLDVLRRDGLLTECGEAASA